MPPDSIEPSTSDPAGGVGAAAVPEGPGDRTVEAVPVAAVDVLGAVGPLAGEHATRMTSTVKRPVRSVASPIRGEMVRPANGLASEPAPA